MSRRFPRVPYDTDSARARSDYLDNLIRTKAGMEALPPRDRAPRATVNKRRDYDMRKRSRAGDVYDGTRKRRKGYDE
jgi:hypothetical protein